MNFSTHPAKRLSEFQKQHETFCRHLEPAASKVPERIRQRQVARWRERMQSFVLREVRAIQRWNHRRQN